MNNSNSSCCCQEPHASWTFNQNLILRMLCRLRSQWLLYDKLQHSILGQKEHWWGSETPVQAAQQTQQPETAGARHHRDNSDTPATPRSRVVDFEASFGDTARIRREDSPAAPDHLQGLLYLHFSYLSELPRLAHDCAVNLPTSSAITAWKVWFEVYQRYFYASGIMLSNLARL